MSRRPCERPSPVGQRSLRELVEQYLRTKDPCSDIDLVWYRRAPSLSEAVRRAALCEIRGGLRHPHQRRIPRETLVEAAKRLTTVRRLDRARDFEELLAMVTKACWGLCGLGVLARYDIAFRIGLYLKKHPRLVYLHLGTRDGAKALGLPYTRPYLAISDLPIELRDLEPWQVEDFLCIYREELRPDGGTPRE